MPDMGRSCPSIMFWQSSPSDVSPLGGLVGAFLLMLRTALAKPGLRSSTCPLTRKALRCPCLARQVIEVLEPCPPHSPAKVPREGRQIALANPLLGRHFLRCSPASDPAWRASFGAGARAFDMAVTVRLMRGCCANDARPRRLFSVLHRLLSGLPLWRL